MKIKVLTLISILSVLSCSSQKSLQEYIGGWAGKITEKDPFAFHIAIDSKSLEKPVARFIGHDTTTIIELRKEQDRYLVGQFKNQLTIRVDTTGGIWTSFIQTGHHLSNLELKKSTAGVWEGDWNLLIGEHDDPTIYISLEKSDNEVFSASIFFKEPPLHYSSARDFNFKENEITFFDYNSDLAYKGILQNEHIELSASFLNEKTSILLHPLSYEEWKIGQAGKNNNKEQSLFPELVRAIKNDSLDHTHAVAISRNGEVLFEEYFDGFTASTPHDVRSLAKSFAGSMVGIAIEENKIANEHLVIKDFFENEYSTIEWTEGKERITIHHLLSMSSGLDAIDFGLNRTSFANEGAYQSQEDWTQHILSAPMIYAPGEQSNYGSGSPHLIGPILNSTIDERMDFYMHKKLFAPLSIKNYRVQTDRQGEPYFGGGWYFTPRDLLKFGELYLNKGVWNNKQLMAEQWIEKSIDKYFQLQNTTDKNEYGYLFWHRTYEVGGKKIPSIEARGNGGQYLFIVPDYDLVVAITSGNYRNGKFKQPELIMEEYILPEIIN